MRVLRFFQPLAPTEAMQLCHLNIKVMSVTIENRALPNFDPILLIVCFRVSLKIDTLKKDECLFWCQKQNPQI